MEEKSKKNNEVDIIQISAEGIFTTRKLPPYVQYEDGYSHQNLPKLVRKSRDITRHFRGVRSCDDRDRRDEEAKRALGIIKSELERYNPNLKVVRSGWIEGTHYWNNTGGGFGTSGRKYNGYIKTTFYVDFERPESLVEFFPEYESILKEMDEDDKQ